MSALTGTWELVRLAVRRDRVMLPVWLAVFVLTAASSASATVGLYPSVSSRVEAAAGINDIPSLVALYGRIYDPTSLGALSMIKLSAMGAALVAVLAIIVAVRHTRAEEEAGRLELLGSTVLGRLAPLTASMLLVIGSNLLLGFCTAVGVMATGLPADGSLAFGLSWCLTGIAFGSVALVFAQLTTSARAATGLASAFLGATYVLRAIGDASPSDGPRWLSWLSPIGWAQQMRPFAGNRWWVAIPLLAFAAVTTVIGYALTRRRDHGAGLLPDRPGPAVASPGLSTPLGLAWRLQRGLLIGWLVAFALLGAVLGSIATSVGTMMDSEQAREMFTRLGGEKGLTDAFLATEFSFIAVFVSVYGVQAAMRLRSEESALRAEPVLATSTGRVRWATSHVLIALSGVLALLLVGGLSAGIVYATQTGHAGDIGRVLAAALVQLPAAALMTGIVVAGFGLLPRLGVLGWVALVAFLLIGEFGPLFKLNQWALDLSPFAHTPKLPGSPFALTPLVWLTVIAAALLAAGMAGLRRRDIG